MISPSLDSFSFQVLARPLPKQRPRLGRRGKVFTPQRTHDYEALMRHVALAAMPRDWRMNCHYAVEMRFAFRGGLLPDTDNLIKVLDSLNGAVWDDDRQVVEISALRVTCEPGEAENTRVVVHRVSEALPAKRKPRPKAPSAVKAKRAPRRRGRS